MQTQRRTKVSCKSIAKQLEDALGEPEIDRIARLSGFLVRKRDVTPLALLCACLSTFAAGKSRWLADILRRFNWSTKKVVRYKPFHNQLSKPAFAEFARLTLCRVLETLKMPMIQALPGRKVSMFTDILLHDGTSFALNDSLAAAFPGRFTKLSPAAVELHVTMSVFTNSVMAITMAPDKESERAFSPLPDDIKGCLLLEDRGYEGKSHFRKLHDAGAYFIIRGKKSIRPTIVRAQTLAGRRIRRLEGEAFHPGMVGATSLDLDIAWGTGATQWRGRLIALCSGGRRNKARIVLLHTNLSRRDFSAKEVGVLYRLRWQIELLFKEWKSHACLHKFETSKPAIAEGLIWMSLLAATLKRFLSHAGERLCQRELSTQRVAKSGFHFLEGILQSLLQGPRALSQAIQRAISYMEENTQRSNPTRDRTIGRFSAGLAPVIAAKN